MINRIKVCEDGHVFADTYTIGRTGENNAIIFKTEFFKELNGLEVSVLQKVLVAENSLGSFVYELEGELLFIPAELTNDPSVTVQFEIRNNADVLWKSNPQTFTLVESLNFTASNLIDSAIAEARVEFEEDLRGALETATGADLSGDDWDNLIYKTAELDVLDSTDMENIGAWRLIEAYFSKWTRNGNILCSNSPDGKEYELPYLPTRNTVWDSSFTISNKLLACGFDFSASSGISNVNVPSPFATSRVVTLKMTGLRSFTTFCDCFQGNTSLQNIELYGIDVTKAAQKNLFYHRTFQNCSVLHTISGDPLDFTEITKADTTFAGCKALHYVRFKPFTLSTSLFLGDSIKIHLKLGTVPVYDFGTLISLLNAITNDSEAAHAMTITLASTVQNVYGDCKLDFDEATGLYSLHTDDDTDFHETLDTAFMMKGVTLAWQS